MAEVVAILVSWVVTIGSVALILRWDERRLTPEQLARAWPPATRLSAIGYSFIGLGIIAGALCVPIHFWRTRRTVMGTLAGFGLAVLVLALTFGALILVDLAFGAFDDPS